ncbi:MAG: glucokinase [Gammaproteobacteria bacterium RBG_16_57_12]|nr:MAG: glucokinase [Gammaproteobacteria bacterium RBG_16_57_12]
MRVLAGDIGGTKTLLQVVDVDPLGCRQVWEQRFDSQSYGDFSALLAEFLDHAQQQSPGMIESACLGVAGPVVNAQARITNLPWTIDARQLMSKYRLPHVSLINDFQAIGYGIGGLRETDFVTLQSGQPRPRGPRALIGAGTGLGEGLMLWMDNHYEVLPSEGGHVDFAPTTSRQMDLLQHLAQRMERVSYECIVSGPGLVRIHEFLCAAGPLRPSAAFAAALQSADDPAACISQHALQGNEPIAEQTLELFLEIYGAQAGNLALTVLASGGVYIAGGIAPKLIDRLRDGTFIRAFNHKSPMSGLTSAMPVKVVMNPHVGLIGAALKAAREGAGLGV